MPKEKAIQQRVANSKRCVVADCYAPAVAGIDRCRGHQAEFASEKQFTVDHAPCVRCGGSMAGRHRRATLCFTCTTTNKGLKTPRGGSHGKETRHAADSTRKRGDQRKCGQS